jgi:Protein of unknown function DUF262
MICFFSSGNHRPIWHCLAMLRSWGLCPQTPGVYRFGLMGRDMTYCMPRPSYWPFGIIRRSGCPPAEPYPAYDALSSLVKRWVPVTFRNRNQKSGFAPAPTGILIDGQQRVTALMAGLLGREVLTKDYETIRIKIAFHPQEERFEVSNPAIAKDAAWIPDVAQVFAPEADLIELIDDYSTRNVGADRKTIGRVLQRLGKIINNHLGIIELAEDLDIETVTEIFIRVNSAGSPLSQADFAMSKIAANESYGGNMLRKAIDYFCHLAIAPEFHNRIKNGDKAFADSEFFPKLSWLKDVNDDLYDPSYTDMLRVAFTSEFKRGKLQDLVALLSGRNFETKQYEDAIAEESFGRLKKGIIEFLPALPTAFPAGSFSGVCLRGGFKTDFSWEDGVLTQATVHSGSGGQCFIDISGRAKKLRVACGTQFKVESGILTAFVSKEKPLQLIAGQLLGS